MRNIFKRNRKPEVKTYTIRDNRTGETFEVKLDSLGIRNLIVNDWNLQVISEN